MTLEEWTKLFAAALGGGFTVEILRIFYEEYRRRSDHSQSAKDFVDAHLDPLLKIADELVGKIRSLSSENFETLHHLNRFHVDMNNRDFASLLYLFGKFWAQLEIIRTESLSVSLVSDIRGRQLQSFIDCLESTRVRLVDRISQRAIGEIMLKREMGELVSLSYIDFVTMIETDVAMYRWITPLIQELAFLHDTTNRQKILQYGIVMHALIDTLDPKHQVTRDRPSYPGKLAKKTWQDIKYRIFGVYLTFVRHTDKYLDPSKNRSGPKTRKNCRDANRP